MKILFCSICFYPSSGGIETVSHILAEEFVRAGAQVTLVTETPSSETDNYPFTVVRRPSKQQLMEMGKLCDVIYQNNISLKSLLPLLRTRKPIVVTTATWIARNDGGMGWQDRLKKLALRLVHNVAISKPIAASLPMRSTIIHNPFEMALFSPYRGIPKTKDIVFVGRLVSDKGCDLVLKALALLKTEGLTPSFTVIGDGSLRAELEAMTTQLGLTHQVQFLGKMGESRAQEVGQHAIMVVPSVWAEPFGVVALEGISAGCAIVASSGGGLPEAVGKCGLLFPNNDIDALAAALRILLTDKEKRAVFVAEGVSHLEHFAPDYVAKQYLNLFHEVSGQA